ncbi:MAG: hypothetical protein R2825_13135, partial [Saprospiraceae bacterium]
MLIQLLEIYELNKTRLIMDSYLHCFLRSIFHSSHSRIHTLFFLLFLSITVNAQSVKVSGVVTSAADQMPL